MSLNNKVILSLVVGTLSAMLAWIMIDFTPLYSMTSGVVTYGSIWQVTAAQVPLAAIFGMLVGLGLGFVNGLSSGSRSQLKRNMAWGIFYGILGGVLGIYFGQLIYGPLHRDPGSVAPGSLLGPLVFLSNVFARAIGWGLIGLFLGASQGFPIGSKKMSRHGAIGGFIGGMIGGSLFEMVPFILPLGKGSGVMARGISMSVTGAFIGFFIGLVDILMKQAWVRVVHGRNEGREHIISKDRTTIGRDELADIGLFGDPSIASVHAVIDSVGGGRHILRDAGSGGVTKVDGRRVTDYTLRDGEIIEIGSMKLEFHEKATMSRVPKRSDIAPPQPVQIPTGPNNCPFCGSRKDPVTGACACSVAGQSTQLDPMLAPSQPNISAAGSTMGDSSPRITAIGGPYIGQTFQLSRSGVTNIGRDGNQDVNLPNDSTVSRHHARIVNEGGILTVYDDGSSNGTTVNGMRISRNPIVPGDVVAFGSSTFRYDA